MTVLLVPIARLGLEYDNKESRLNVYIKCFFNIPPMVGHRKMECFARVIVAKHVKRNWFPPRRPPIFNLDDVDETDKVIMETIPVLRHSSPIFNEFFSCDLETQSFHTCAIKIQFGHITRFGHKSIVAEADYWIDENPIKKFTEYDIPLRMANPDLGEIEIGLCYLPSAERLVFNLIQATNLRFLNTSSASRVYAHVHLLVGSMTIEKWKTSEVEGTDPRFDLQFSFELPRKDVPKATLAITLIEICDEKKAEIGRVILSGNAPGAEHTCWRRMIIAPRQRHTEVHKLYPC